MTVFALLAAVSGERWYTTTPATQAQGGVAVKGVVVIWMMLLVAAMGVFGKLGAQNRHGHRGGGERQARDVGAVK